MTELTEVEDSDEDYLPIEEQKQEVVMKTFVPKQETTRKSGVPPVVPAAALDENPSPEKKNPGTPSIPCPQVMIVVMVMTDLTYIKSWFNFHSQILLSQHWVK